jgi:hypothetical protein
VELSVVAGWDQLPAAGRIVFSTSPRDPHVPHRRWVRIGDERWIVDDTPHVAGGREIVDLLLAEI